MCFLVAVYTITSIVFLLQVNQYTQDIYDFPYLVSSQARIMKSRLYDFRSLTPVLFSSKDLNSTQLESALKTQETLQRQSITIIEDRYRGSPEELQELKDALKISVSADASSWNSLAKIPPSKTSLNAITKS